MKFALDLPNFGLFSDPRLLVELAKDAEEAGWDAFFIWDHIARITTHDVVDPWIALAAIAAQTRTMRIGAMVTPIARRRPWKLARETVTLDRLSNGRLIFGAGLGGGSSWREEWANLGEEVNLKTRAKMLDEGLDILDGLWRGKPFSYDGEQFQIAETTFTPTPLQQPRIPTWIAGLWPNKPPFRRAARWDGLIPLLPEDGDPLNHMKAAIDYTRQHRQTDAPFDIVYMTQPTVENTPKAAETRAAFAEAGVTWWLEELNATYFGSTWEGEWDLAPVRAFIRQGPPTP